MCFVFNLIHIIFLLQELIPVTLLLFMLIFFLTNLVSKQNEVDAILCVSESE